MQRIQLGNTLFEGRNNVYVLDGGDELTLVDTAVSTTDTAAQLRADLAAFGHTLADVDSVVLTHWHPDHAGLAGELQAESGATVYVHEADAGLVSGEASERERYHALERQRFEEWQIPADKREELSQFLAGHDDIRGDPVAVTPLSHGDVVAAGAAELETVHLPGHAAGTCAFAFDGEQGREAFVGDVVLPKYTPNVGGADLRVEAPLATYVESLQEVVDAGYDRVWPGHREVIDRPTDRTRTILDHHTARTERVVGVLSEHGPCNVWTVSAHLFGELQGIHILHGPGEAFAHLDHLESAGVVERDGDAYALVDDRPTVGELFPAAGP